MATTEDSPWFLKSTHPVDFPFDVTFTISREQFQNTIAEKFGTAKVEESKDEDMVDVSDTPVTESVTVTPGSDSDGASALINPSKKQGSAFMQGLVEETKKQNRFAALGEGLMRTENNDVAFATSSDPLVDLFYELEGSVDGVRLQQLLEDSWRQDPLATLKVIFNARSIHLGKSERKVFYRCAGWLYQHHPQTLIANLEWISRPVIPKKAEKKDGEDDAVIVEVEPEEDDPAWFDVQFGVSHGYWKDILNILVLAVNDKLDVLSDPTTVLNVEDEHIKRAMMEKRGVQIKSRRGRGRGRGGQTEKVSRPAPLSKKEIREQRHARAVAAFENNTKYRMLHIAVARLFAEQIKSDTAALHGDDAKAKKNISLCAKWAPSDDLFHDKHTFVISSIAQLLYVRERLYGISPDDSHEVYLRKAREQYRRDVSALRKHLDVVERNISANTLDKIRYDRLPSIAMNKYQSIFVRKDTDRFINYLDKVADGKSRISGATLLPSLLIKQALLAGHQRKLSTTEMKGMRADAIVTHKVNMAAGKVLDGQWKSLVQRIKDSGSLDNCIAVCDVSGSMDWPVRKDGTTPMHSAIGLSLLMAEVAKPPFAGSFITFSTNPSVETVRLEDSLQNKVYQMHKSDWDGSTDFCAVFEKLILPMAIRNKLSQEEMVKKIFVFSDMQFNAAENTPYRYEWQTGQGEQKDDKLQSSFERIKKAYTDAGYEMPELVFWNLAGSRMGSTSWAEEGASAKPTDAFEEGVSLVSGYSQGMLKVFMEGSGFDGGDEDEAEMVEVDGETKTLATKKKDPRDMVDRAVKHKAYDMIKVYD